MRGEKKTTEELVNELQECENLELFKKSNAEAFIYEESAAYLKDLLVKRGQKKADVVRKSGLSQVYGYQILSGAKHAERDKLLCIALGMDMTLAEANLFLRLEGKADLYPRLPRDAVIIYALNQHLSVAQTDDLLYEHGEETLLEQ